MVRDWIAIGFTATVLFVESGFAVEQARGTTSLRALIATPDLYANRPVTVTGRFRGRIGYDNAAFHPPNRSRWDL